MKKIILTLFLVPILLVSCSSNDDVRDKDLTVRMQQEWLVGDWIATGFYSMNSMATLKAYRFQSNNTFAIYHTYDGAALQDQDMILTLQRGIYNIVEPNVMEITYLMEDGVTYSETYTLPFRMNNPKAFYMYDIKHNPFDGIQMGMND